MGKITKIAGVNGRGKRVNIFVDGRFTLALDVGVAFQEKLKVDTELDPDRVKSLAITDEIQRGFDYALRYLGYRPRSDMELRNRLKHQGFSVNIINDVIKKLKNQSLVDDSAFARFWTENREAFSPRSRYFVTRELKQKGIAKEVIDTSVNNINDEDNAYRSALIKARRLNMTDYANFRKNVGGYLQRRGFDYEIINKTIEKIWQEKREGTLEKLT